MDRNDSFLFLRELNEDLYKRYLIIEDTLRNTNGNVYVEMQAFLEHLFRYISRRENFNLHQTTLGDCLKNNHIIKFCLVRLEYDNLEQLRVLNTYGNYYKHQKVIDFNYDEFIKCMKEVYIISRKVYNFYKKKFINQFKMFDPSYFYNLVLKERERKEAEDLNHEKLKLLSDLLLKKNDEIIKLEKLLKETESKNMMLEKRERSFKEEVQILLNTNEILKDKIERIQTESKSSKSIMKELRDRYKYIEAENLKLKQYQVATEGLVCRLLKNSHLTHIDLEVINKIISELKDK